MTGTRQRGAGRTGTERSVPVLVLTGVGLAAAARLRTVPVLEKRFRVLAFEAGRAADPAVGRLVAQIAGEVAERLDEAGVPVVHVYGLSFGGMVAQELALANPERVRSLVLGATSGGGALRTPPDERTRQFLRRRADMPADEALWAAVPYGYALTTRRRRAARIAEDMLERSRSPVDAALHRVQRAAALEHDAADRLHRIAVPTLVVHGDEDRMVPVENGRALAEAIRGARLTVVRNAAHMYPTDAPQADRAIVRFLLEQSATGAPPARSRSGRAARA